jgi:hypothetical protein
VPLFLLTFTVIHEGGHWSAGCSATPIFTYLAKIKTFRVPGCNITDHAAVAGRHMIVASRGLRRSDRADCAGRCEGGFMGRPGGAGCPR